MYGLVGSLGRSRSICERRLPRSHAGANAEGRNSCTYSFNTTIQMLFVVFILHNQFLGTLPPTTDSSQLQQQDHRIVHEATEQTQRDPEGAEKARLHFMALSTRRDTAQAAVTTLMARLLELFPQLATEAVDESTGNTPLYNAARFGFADRAKLLVKGGADVTTLNKVSLIQLLLLKM